MKNFNRKILSIVLCLALLFTVIPLTVNAEYTSVVDTETLGTLETEETLQNDTQEPHIVFEMSEKRESNIKHYRMSDGSIKAAVYPYDVHYKNENNEYVDIDNSLTEENDGTDDVYANKDNIASVKFMKKSNPNKLYTIEKGDYKIKISVDGVSKVSGVKETLDNETLPENQFTLENIGSKITYSDILENTDFEYTLVSTRLKENIILKKKVDFNSLIYNYHFTGSITAVTEDDKNIEIYEKDSNNLIFNISAPTMWDSAGNYYDDLSLEIIEIKNSKIKVLLNWSIDDNAVYPITVDPILGLSADRNVIQDTHIIKSQPGRNYDANNHIRVRNDGYALVKFPTPTTFKSGDKVINAQLVLTPYMYLPNAESSYSNANSYNPAIYITAHKILKAWQETTVTYTTANPDNGFYDSTVYAYRIVDGDASLYDWDITRLANEWIEGGVQNNGILLKFAASPSDGSMFDAFFASNNGLYNPQSTWPLLVYQYINTTGIESYFSYHSQDIGRAGTAYVNDLTGNLTLINPIVQTGGSLTPINVSLVYNTNNVNDAETPYGKGWKLNWSQKIDRTIQSKFDYTIAQYVDGDGTEHYFNYDAASGLFTDEKDKKRWIIWIDANTYELTENDGSSMIFVKPNSTAIWYLTKVKDSYGNYIQIHRNSSNYERIDKITSTGGYTIDFVYNSEGFLTTLKYYDGDTTKQVTLEYIKIVPSNDNSDKTITKVHFADGKYCEYHYHTNYNYLAIAEDLDEYNMQYTYYWGSIKRVRDIIEVSNDEVTQGARASIQYHPTATVYTDVKNNRKYLYTFAVTGTLKSVVDITSNDGNGYAQYYEYNKGITDEMNGMGNLTFMSKTQKSTVNLIKQHSFEKDIGIIGSTSTNVTAGTWTGYHSTLKPRLGNMSYRLYRSADIVSDRTYANMQQNVTAGTKYTLSAYVNTEEMVSQGKGANLVVATSAGEFASEFATEARSDWQRIYVTFTAPATESVGIRMNFAGATGIVYFDNIQLEVGDLSDYNILENAGFEEAWGTTAPSWGCYSGPGTCETTNVASGSQAVKFVGGVTHANEYSQYIYIKNGKADDTYIASAFAKATSVPKNGWNFAILVRFKNGSTTVNSELITFNTYTTEWQKVSGVARADGDYDVIYFFLLYYNNCNTVYFDNAQLIKDNFGTSYEYDANGNLKTVFDLESEKENEFQYNSNNKLIQQTNVAGGKIDYTYNTTNKHQLDKVESGGLTTAFTYDSRGNALTSTTTGSDTASTKKITSSATYTANGEYTDTMTDSRGNVTNYDYNNDRGLLTKVTSPNGTTTNYTYDSSEVLSSVTVANSGNTLSSTVGYQYYDTNKLLKSITSPGGTVYNFTYDKFRRTDTIKVGTRLLSDYTYDNKGRLSEMLYGNGTTLAYSYDSLNRKTGTTINDILRYKYEYDGKSRLTSALDVLTGKKIKYEYDIIDRLTHERLVDTVTNTIYAQLNIRYDNDKNRVAGYDVSIDGNTKAMDYIYGELERAPDVINGVKQNGTRILSYGYDDFNRLSTRTLATTTPFVTEYTYYQGATADNTTTLINSIKNGDTTYRYVYDNMGNITTVRKGNYIEAMYTYDYLGQLHYADLGYPLVFIYTYDEGGNVTSVRGDGPPSKTFTYGNSEWKDLLTNYNGTEITYDTIGNPLNFRDGMTFTWADGRKLTNIVKGTDNISYTYNADGLRDSKIVNGIKTEYYWLNGVLQGQKTGSEYMFFLYDENGQVYGFLLKNGTTEEYYYYVFNAQGDVVEILDSTGTSVVQYTYDPWGDILSTAGTLVNTIGQKNPIRYRGYYQDNETAFYYLQSRYYDPITMRFINADGAIASVGGEVSGYNQFAYCFNNPVNLSDETGDWPRWITATVAAVAAVVAVVATVVSAPVVATVATTVAVVSTVAYVAQSHHYDKRKAKNTSVPKTYDEAMKKDGADNTISAACHQFTAGDEPNKKVCWPDGTEGIYNSSGELVLDPRDVGTYNFSVPNGGWSSVWHGVVDVAPWIIFGNDDDDNTWMYQRVISLFNGE